MTDVTYSRDVCLFLLPSHLVPVFLLNLIGVNLRAGSCVSVCKHYAVYILGLTYIRLHPATSSSPLISSPCLIA